MFQKCDQEEVCSPGDPSSDSGKLHKISLQDYNANIAFLKTGRVAQSVTCLATDASRTADPGVASLIPARSHTFVEIDYEIVSVVILLPSTEPFKKDCYQLRVKVCARSTG